MTDMRKSILVVDDDIDILEQTKVNLEAGGYNVRAAESQEEAEEILKSFKPDMAVLDLMMENQDSGFILGYKIKKMNPNIPVVIVTAVTSQTGIAFDANGGGSWIKADAVIEKPIRYEQLLGQLKHLQN